MSHLQRIYLNPFPLRSAFVLVFALGINGCNEQSIAPPLSEIEKWGMGLPPSAALLASMSSRGAKNLTRSTWIIQSEQPLDVPWDRKLSKPIAKPRVLHVKTESFPPSAMLNHLANYPSITTQETLADTQGRLIQWELEQANSLAIVRLRECQTKSNLTISILEVIQP